MSGGDSPQEETQPIIIVKKISHAGHHGGAWKVAYADFVTAMMALFIVLWILGQSEEVRQGVSGYFKDPSAVGKGGVGLLEGRGTSKAPTMTPTRGPKPLPSEDPLRELERQAEALKATIENTPELLDIKEQIQIEVTSEGVRIEMLDNARDQFFQLGSSELTESLKLALTLLGKKLKELPSKIVIEGHTDSAPYSLASHLSNWELSTERANRARRVMLAAGLPDERIFAVRGYADRRLRFPEDSLDARNRRISILLLSPEGLAIAQGITDLQQRMERGIQ